MKKTEASAARYGKSYAWKPIPHIPEKNDVWSYSLAAVKKEFDKDIANGDVTYPLAVYVDGDDLVFVATRHHNPYLAVARPHRTEQCWRYDVWYLPYTENFALDELTHLALLAHRASEPPDLSGELKENRYESLTSGISRAERTAFTLRVTAGEAVGKHSGYDRWGKTRPPITSGI